MRLFGLLSMIRLTKQTDYGILLMSQIAAADRSCNAPELAADTHLPLPMVSKILKLLTRSGLLASERGVKGGYRLARPADEVSVADLIEVLEGRIALTGCLDGSAADCSYEAFCRVRGNWQRINGAVREALDGITLEEMAHPWRHRADMPALFRNQPLISIGLASFVADATGPLAITPRKRPQTGAGSLGKDGKKLTH